ncbi:hypothetical protein [Aeromicrobium wangtongii]|uniref:Capsular polysaccharide biosynthesis protein n=1 Tax=Aeromicrobium wangtongii TaxID=2969247 RepID=A0ABY5M7S0_9ACTN|nr:hypothetical protein [Aeromicrobium wangtongii]MCD9198976.1 hypothetical protein [Aeromicrobium wangtongii]UUP12989.1 hypothetical protein NQV15_14160 [Aeromicrobium wangtongii]
MRVDELVRSLLRRPMGLVLVVLIALGGAGYGWRSASTTYESTASVLILPPAGSDGTASSNPLVNLDYNMSQLALTVSSQLQSDQVQEAVADAGGDGAYSADTLSSENSAIAQLTPMVALVASASTAEGARSAAAALVDQVSVQLAEIQESANVPGAARATAVISTPPGAGSAVGSARLRAAGVLGLACGFAALLGLVALQPSARGGGRSRSGVPKAAIRARLQEEWERSGRNVALSRAEAREAWRRTEALLAAERGTDVRALEATAQRRSRRA